MVSSTISPQASSPTSPTGAASGRFVCPVCKNSYGDPFYHGPAGHAPPQLCYDCWASEWASMTQMLSRGGNWRQIDSALFLLCQGFSYQEAANLAGICRRTLHNWIRQARQHPEMAPQWLISRARTRELMRT
jgi:hypothetical protein